jgi:uncharacterized protein YhjY with autotransporter beta-barrel domain
MRKLLFIALSFTPALAQADNGSGSLAGSLGGICSAATPGNDFFTRCQEFLGAFDPQAATRIAAGQRLEELPGQGRAGTRNQQQEKIVAEDLGEGWSLFLSADLGQLDRSTSFNEAAFDGSADRFTGGLNYQVNAHWLLGLALNHTREKLDFDQSNSRNSSSMNGALLTGNFSPVESFSFDAYYGRFSGDTTNVRNINYTIESTPGNFQSFASQAFATPGVSRKVAGISGSWLWNKAAWSGGINLGMDQSKTKLNNYRENGGDGFGLDVPERNIKSQTGSLSFNISRTYSMNWGVLIPSARLGLKKEFDNPSRQLAVQFSQDSSNTDIVFDTSDPDTQWGEVGVGVSLVMKKGHQAFFEYRQRFGHSFLEERSLALGWRMEF